MDDEPLPQLLRSSVFGELKLREVSVPGFYAFHYTGSWKHQGHDTIKVVFHPPKREFGQWEKALRDAELRALDMLHSQRAILLTGERHLQRVFKDYRIGRLRIDKLFPDLKLTMLKLISSDNDEMVYAPCKWFSSLDLIVSVDRDLRVSKAHFAG